MARLANELTALEFELINRMKKRVFETKSNKVSFPIEDLIEQGYSLERIQESLSFLSNVDMRDLDDDTLQKIQA
jgi:hypothetical protein